MKPLTIIAAMAISAMGLMIFLDSKNQKPIEIQLPTPTIMKVDSANMDSLYKHLNDEI